MHWDAIVIGAGAAGLLAATRAAERGRRTLLLEKNRKPGVKILMSGGTRCNLTHACDRRGIVDAFGPNGRFLHSALAALGPDELVALIEAEGVPTKVEPTGKIFPVSNKATDVLSALLKRLQRSRCTLALGEAVLQLQRADEGFHIRTSSRSLAARAVIVTTGGQSYPGCGTTGDGYAWARAFGHAIVPPRPALVPLTTDEAWVHSLKGVTLPEVTVHVLHANAPKPIAQRTGSFLFTHFGISGPVGLDVSRAITEMQSPGEAILECDFVPRLSAAELDEHLRLESSRSGKKLLALVLGELLPRRLCDALLARAGLPPDRKAAGLSKADRQQLVCVLKRQRISITGTLGFKKAEVTAGGIALDEVDSRTMQSKLIPGLYLAGEVLDLDGWIGGYNFQAAFSTGWLAGECV
jgi:hypothetical protein